MNINVQKKALLYVPFMVFNPYHHLRDQGGTASGFVSEGYDTTLIIGNISGIIPETAYNIVKTHNTQPRGLISTFREAFALIKNLKEIEPDIVLVWNVGVMPFILAIFVKLFQIFGRKKPKIVLRLDWDGTADGRNLLRDLIFRVHLILSNMLFDWTTVETNCGKRRVDKIILRPNKLRVIPVGYYPEATNSNVTNYKRERYILSIARIAKYKNIEQSLIAFSSASEDFPDWRFVHVGMCQDVDYFVLLKELVVKLNIEDRVIFAGELDYEGVDLWFSRCPVFITSSFKESFNLARLEAMVNGLIVISSEAGCSSDFPGVLTFLNTQEATTHLRNAIIEAEMANLTIHQKYESIFSWREIVRLILDFQ